MEVVVLRVSSKSIPNKVASAIVGMTKEGKAVELQGIGAGALSQSTKAVAIANNFVKGEDYEFWGKPEFVEVQIEDKDRTAIKMRLRKFPKDA